MRELEFLPDWYPKLRRRRRMVVIQAWLTVVMALSLALWLFMAHRNTHEKQAQISRLEGQLAQTHSELRQLDELLDIKRQLQVQEQVISKIGVHVEVTRMLAELDRLMPKEMSLLDLKLDTLEQPRKVDNVVAAMAAKDEPMDRRLLVHLWGVAPSDLDLANFYGKLGDVPFFDHVAIGESADFADNGHLMRKFELTFMMDLNSQAKH
jgi:Tfp pilus assembly protein PilN